MKIIFMGTPDFAVPTLQALINSTHHKITAVFTAPPRPKNRGLKLTLSPVHQLASDHNIKVYNPLTLRGSETQEMIQAIEADIIIVAAYGLIVPPAVLTATKYGCINIHPSLLPKYRGAAPLQWTIINGDKESAVCIMQMDAGLDTGDIILQQNFNVPERITFRELHDKCAKLGAELLLQAVGKIEELPRTPQSDQGVVYAHKLTKEDGKINWQESAYQIDCKIRGMNPWPGTYFEYQGRIINIMKAEYSTEDHEFTPGAIINNNLEFACGQGILKIHRLKPEGKKEMEADEFLRGYHKN